MKQRFGRTHLKAWGLLGCPEWRVGQHIISKCLGQLGRALNSCGHHECQRTAPLGGCWTCLFACTLEHMLSGIGESVALPVLPAPGVIVGL